MVKGSILFPMDKKVDLQKLDDELSATPEFTRWEKSESKSGFSGLDYDIVEVNGVNYQRVLIIWSDDGKSGHVRDDLESKKHEKVLAAIERHDGDRKA